MSNLYIQHNALDTIQFNELINSSALLSRYIKDGTHHLEHFQVLIQDIFHIHFKHAVYLDHPNQQTVNYQIITNLLVLSQLLSLRQRTVGSLPNTYLAFKLIIDGLFESLRGRTLIKDIEETLHTLNKMNAIKQMTNTIEEKIDNIDLDKILSKHEQSLLKTYLKKLNKNTESPITENDWINSLINEIFDALNTSEDVLLNKQIKSAIDKSHINNNQSATETLLENLLKENMDDLSDESIELETEIDKTDKETSDDFKESLKDELEEKFAPFLKEQYLTQGQQQNSQQRFISELDSEQSSDINIIQQGKANILNQVTQQTIQQLSSKQENLLRQINQPSHNHSDHSNKECMPYPDDSYKKVENHLKTQMKKLNLPSVLSKAISSIDEFNQTTRTLGIKEKTLNHLSFDEVMAMHKRYAKPSFIKFVNKVGKNKLYASQIQYKKKKEHAIPIDKVCSSHNIDLLIEEEYIALALDIEAFENDFYDRYLRDDLLTIDMISKFDKRKGPIVLCYDGSGSMEGIKIEETQSHILAILEIAKIQKRHLILIQFASAGEPLYIKEINPTQVTAQDVFDVLDEFICGGTDFEKPLSKAIEFIKTNQHKKSDILFITDGQCEIRKTFKEDFLKLKQERDFKLYTVIMHAYTYHDYGDIGDISDAVLEIKGRDIGNWNEATNKKLYSLI